MYGSTVAELNEEVAEVSKRKSQSARGVSRAFQYEFCQCFYVGSFDGISAAAVFVRT